MCGIFNILVTASITTATTKYGFKERNLDKSILQDKNEIWS
jgi:hypothetical protein